jgi:chemotaxis protein CheD
MKIPGKEDLSLVKIKAGECYVTNQDVMVTTLLGSCVSACLYDPDNKIIGMNHFLLSNKRYAKNMPYYVTEAGRYGIHAMEMLINAMMKLGARRENIRAKAFGGSSLLQSPERYDNFFCVGEVNSRFIYDFLTTEKIPLVISDLGGNRGRVIYFCSDDFSVYVRKIKKTINRELAQKEKRFWQKSIESQEKKIAEPDVLVWEG